MRRKKRTEVFTETQVEIEIKGRTRRLSAVWCTECGAEVELMPPDVAGLVAEVSARTVFGWVEMGRVHFIETPDGALLVCLNSLPHALSASAKGAGLNTETASRTFGTHEQIAPTTARHEHEGCDSLTERDSERRSEHT